MTLSTDLDTESYPIVQVSMECQRIRNMHFFRTTFHNGARGTNWSIRRCFDNRELNAIHATEENWNAVSSFTTAVLKKLWREEQERRDDSSNNGPPSRRVNRRKEKNSCWDHPHEVMLRDGPTRVREDQWRTEVKVFSRCGSTQLSSLCEIVSGTRDGSPPYGA